MPVEYHKPRCNFCFKELLNAVRVQQHIMNTKACREAWDREVQRHRIHSQTDNPAQQPTINANPEGDDVYIPLNEDLDAIPEPHEPFIPAARHPRSQTPESQPQTKQAPRRFAKEYPNRVADDLGESRTEFENIWQEQKNGPSPENHWAPFKDEEEWGLAEWLIEESTGKARDSYLRLPITKNRTKPSYTSNHTFMKKVNRLPTGPGWTCEIISLTGDRKGRTDNKFLVEELELWHRNPVECVEELIGNPAFHEYISYIPEEVYVDEEGTKRIYDEMWTGEWWWKIQGRLPLGAVLAPIILASDKTHLTNFGGDKSAWPVYLTIGNISKELRRQSSSRATVLVAYLPVSKFSAFTKGSRQYARYNTFHHCMRILLEPLIEAGTNGVILTCADGRLRCIYPILAAYVADHPEQCLVVCCKENRCPRCVVPSDKRGDQTNFRAREPAATLRTLERHQNGEEPHRFEDEGLRSCYYPFWADLPHANIFHCISPDILHQLHRGIFIDHIVPWISEIVSEAEIDMRFQAMSKFQGLRHFKSGISSISQWTGKEVKEMERVFLGVIAGVVDNTVFSATQGILDFIYYAQYQSHTEDTLSYMQKALDRFHANKHGFVDRGIRNHFNIPKFHSTIHYINSIRFLGSADGFNTESPECLHIDYAKNVYKGSSRIDYIAQMTKWLQQQEAVSRRNAYLEWVALQTRSEDDVPVIEAMQDQTNDDELEFKDKTHIRKLARSFIPSGIQHGHGYRVAKASPFPNTSVNRLELDFGAVNFIPAFQAYLLEHHPHLTINASRHDCFDLYNSIIILIPSCIHTSDLKRLNKIRASPQIPNKKAHKRPKPPLADTALIVEDLDVHRELGGLHGFRVAQVRAIFTLPSQYGMAAHPLAYIEWFRPLHTWDPLSHIFILKRSTHNRQRHAAIISAHRIWQACHLQPKFGSEAVDASWTCDNVLENADTFYLNPYINHSMFDLLQ